MFALEKILASITSEDVGKLLLRLTLAILMLFHGFHKLIHGIDGVKFLVDRSGLPEFVAYGVYFGEIVVPILIILGLLTRLSATILAVNMVFAIFLAHGSDLFALTKHGGLAIELALFYLFTSVVLIFIGAGKYSLDKKLNNT